MSDRQSFPLHLHTADYRKKTKVLRGRSSAWSPRTWGLLFAALIILVLVLMAPRYVRAAQQDHLPLTVATDDAGAVTPDHVSHGTMILRE